MRKIPLNSNIWEAYVEKLLMRRRSEFRDLAFKLQFASNTEKEKLCDLMMDIMLNETDEEERKQMKRTIVTNAKEQG
jgi:hypothetical protein